MSNPRLAEMTKQIEFYMSDQNLKTDKFFHNLISSSKDQFIPLNILLNCNKIQKMRPSMRDLEQAVQDSTFLDLSPDKTSFRRKKKILPTLRENLVKIVVEKDFDYKKVFLIRLIKKKGFLFSCQNCLNFKKLVEIDHKKKRKKFQQKKKKKKNNQLQEVIENLN